MTRQEVADLVERINANYPRWPIGRAALDDWLELLNEGGVTADEASRAWRRWLRDRHEFQPTVGELIAHVEALRPAGWREEAARRNEERFWAEQAANEEAGRAGFGDLASMRVVGDGQ